MGKTLRQEEEEEQSSWSPGHWYLPVKGTRRNSSFLTCGPWRLLVTQPCPL